MLTVVSFRTVAIISKHLNFLIISLPRCASVFFSFSNRFVLFFRSISCAHLASVWNFYNQFMSTLCEWWQFLVHSIPSSVPAFHLIRVHFFSIRIQLRSYFQINAKNTYNNINHKNFPIFSWATRNKKSFDLFVCSSYTISYYSYGRLFFFYFVSSSALECACLQLKIRTVTENYRVEKGGKET